MPATETHVPFSKRWSDAKKFNGAVNTLLRAIFFTGSIVTRLVAASLDLMLSDIALTNQAAQAARFEAILKQMGN